VQIEIISDILFVDLDKKIRGPQGRKTSQSSQSQILNPRRRTFLLLSAV
jgi:hypothetical protein